MSDAQFDATVIELRRVSLGGRPERPELEPTRSEILDFHRTRMSPRCLPPQTNAPSAQNPIIKGRRA